MECIIVRENGKSEDDKEAKREANPVAVFLSPKPASVWSGGGGHLGHFEFKSRALQPSPDV